MVPTPARRAWRRWLVMLASCSLAACDNPVTPPVGQGPLADPAAVSAGLRLMDGVFATPAMLSLEALGGLMRIPGSPPASVEALTCGAPRSALPAPSVASRSATALIPDSLRRRVFVYDVASGAYQVSSDTTGPADGIRYTLYSVDSYSRVSVPLSALGWLDLSNQGQADTVHARVTSAATSAADYVIAIAGTQAADTATLSGTVSDGAHSFALHDTISVVGFTQWISATAVDSSDDVRVRMFASRTSFDPFDFNDTLDIALARGAEIVAVRGHIQTYCLIPSTGLTVSVDGADFATVTNGTAGLNVARLDHVPLTAEQTQAILDLKDAQQQLFRGLGAMFTPVRLLLPPN